MLPKGIGAKIEKASYPVPPIFELIKSDGGVDENMMYNTFNMGIGMVLCVDKKDADALVETVRAAGEEAYIIGQTEESSEGGVRLC